MVLQWIQNPLLKRVFGKSELELRSFQTRMMLSIIKVESLPPHHHLNVNDSCTQVMVLKVASRRRFLRESTGP